MGFNVMNPMGYPSYQPMMRGPVFNELKVEDNINQKIIPKEELEREENPDKKPTPRVDLNLEKDGSNEELYE